MVAALQAAVKVHNPKGRIWESSEFLLAGLILAAALVLLAIILAWLKRWRKKATTQTWNANEQLAHFRELYERGELSQAEFERIRQRMTHSLRQEWQIGPGQEKPANGLHGHDASSPPAP